MLKPGSFSCSGEHQRRNLSPVVGVVLSLFISPAESRILPVFNKCTPVLLFPRSAPHAARDPTRAQNLSLEQQNNIMKVMLAGCLSHITTTGCPETNLLKIQMLKAAKGKSKAGIKKEGNVLTS